MNILIIWKYYFKGCSYKPTLKNKLLVKVLDWRIKNIGMSK